MQSTYNEGRYCSRAAALLASLWLLAGCSDEPEQPPAPGQAEYRKFCSTCHGLDGAGRPPAFPPLAGSEWLELGPDAAALVVLVGLTGEIEVAGRTYRGYMPPMRQLSDAGIAAALGHVAGWADWPEAPDPARIAALRASTASLEIFQGRADVEAALEEHAP